MIKAKTIHYAVTAATEKAAKDVKPYFVYYKRDAKDGRPWSVSAAFDLSGEYFGKIFVCVTPYGEHLSSELARQHAWNEDAQAALARRLEFRQ